MINSLKDVTEINGKEIYHIFDEKEIEPWMVENFNVVVFHDLEVALFNMLPKTASEKGGLDSCPCMDLIATAKNMLEYINEKSPCRENAMTITKLDEALMWQEFRTNNRIKRGVEGKNES